MNLSGFIVVVVIAIIILYFKDKKENEAFQKELDRISGLDIERKKLEIMKLQNEKDKFKTNHILHLLLSIFTVSLWIIPWFFIAQSNGKKREKIDKFISAI